MSHTTGTNNYNLSIQDFLSRQLNPNPARTQYRLACVNKTSRMHICEARKVRVCHSPSPLLCTRVLLSISLYVCVCSSCVFLRVLLSLSMCAFVTLSLASLSPCHSPNPPRPCFSCLFLPLSSPFSHSLSPCRPGTRFIRFSPVFVGQLIRPLIDEFPSVKLHLPRKWASLLRCAILQNCNMHNKSRTMSAFGVIANVALLPRQINPFTSVSTDWLSHRYNTSSLPQPVAQLPPTLQVSAD